MYTLLVPVAVTKKDIVFEAVAHQNYDGLTVELSGGEDADEGEVTTDSQDSSEPRTRPLKDAYHFACELSSTEGDPAI